MCNNAKNTINGKTREERLAELWAAMESALGRELPVKDRHHMLAKARAFILHQMHSEGWGNPTTARLLGLNESTVWIAVSNADFIIKHPWAYPEECQLYKKFRESL